MPYLLEDGSGYLLAEDGGVLLLEGADSAGLTGTIAAVSEFRIRGRLRGVMAAAAAFSGELGKLHFLSATLEASSELRALSVSVLRPDPAADPDAIAAGAAPFRSAWVTLYVDLGRGLEIIPNAKIAAGMTITESLDQYADELQFALVGAEFSPLNNPALAGRRRVALSLVYGGDGAMFAGVVLEGELYSATFDGESLQCAAHDLAARWVSRLVSPDIPAGSELYRAEVARQLLAAASVPVGSVSLANHGGTIRKPVSYADLPLLDFVSDFLTPADAILWCEQGRLHIASIAELVARPPIEIPRNMIARPISIAAPPTTGRNTVTMAAVKFTPAALDGDGEVVAEIAVSVVETSGYYAPLNDGDPGVVHPPAGNQLISRVTTTTVTQGGVVTWELVDEEGWYARHGGASGAMASAGMPYQDAGGWHEAVFGQTFRDGDGTLSPAFPYSGYRFSDGSLRVEQHETFRLVRRTLTQRILDAENRVVAETTRTYGWRLPEKAVAHVGVGGVETLYEPSSVPSGYVMLRDDGSRDAGPAAWSWQSGNAEPTTPLTRNYQREAFELVGHSSQHDTLARTDYDLTAEGQIVAQTTTESSFSRGVPMAPGVFGAYVYGATERSYWSLPQETRDASSSTTTTTHEPLGEDRYRRTVVTTATGATPVSVVSREYGTLPYAQQVTNPYESQEIVATVVNGLGVDLNGAIVAAEQNEFGETVEELAVIARAATRDAAATLITFDMPLEATVHKARMVTPALPEYGANRPALVWSVVRNLSTFRQTITAKVYQAGTV